MIMRALRPCSRMILAVAALTAGCEGKSSLSEEAFCQEYARIECTKVAAFCSFMPSVCEPVRVAVCRDFAARAKGVGHQYNPSKTEPCLKKLEEAYRTLPINAASLKAVDDICLRVFEGTTRAAEPCAADYDCTGPLICDKGRCGTEKLVAAGGGCANIGERCPKDEYCSNANPAALYLCAKRPGAGAACSETQPCSENFRCRTTCTARLDVGAECSGDDDCLSGYCNRYVLPGTTRTCGPGLTFSNQAPSCVAYMSPPTRGTSELSDAGASGDASPGN